MTMIICFLHLIPFFLFCMQVLPVVVADDFDEEPPEEQADQEGMDESVLLSTESSMTHAMANSALSGTNSEADQQQDLAEVLAPLPATAALSDKERRKAEKAQEKAEKEQQKELQKAEKAKEAAAKLCCMCGVKADAKWLSCSCSARSHVECLAKRFLKVGCVLSLSACFKFSNSKKIQCCIGEAEVVHRHLCTVQSG